MRKRYKQIKLRDNFLHRKKTQDVSNEGHNEIGNGHFLFGYGHFQFKK